VRGEKRNAGGVLVPGHLHQAAFPTAKLEIALLQNPQLKLLGRQNGPAAVRQRHALQQQHRGSGSAKSHNAGAKKKAVPIKKACVIAFPAIPR
jgi:hypothetical protein|tara:strand:- start:441 stop:719 length:279 start_codon:yes stop_codon:yes gene_type:complete